MEVAEDEGGGRVGDGEVDGSSEGSGVCVEARGDLRIVGNEVVYAIGDTFGITDSRLDWARF